MKSHVNTMEKPMVACACIAQTNVKLSPLVEFKQAQDKHIVKSNQWVNPRYTRDAVNVNYYKAMADAMEKQLGGKVLTPSLADSYRA